MMKVRYRIDRVYLKHILSSLVCSLIGRLNGCSPGLLIGWSPELSVHWLTHSFVPTNKKMVGSLFVFNSTYNSYSVYRFSSLTVE